jgi:hypothetical protein
MSTKKYPWIFVPWDILKYPLILPTIMSTGPAVSPIHLYFDFRSFFHQFSTHLLASFFAPDSDNVLSQRPSNLALQQPADPDDDGHA